MNRPADLLIFAYNRIPPRVGMNRRAFIRRLSVRIPTRVGMNRKPASVDPEMM
jgi:hypothetical protein